MSTTTVHEGKYTTSYCAEATADNIPEHGSRRWEAPKERPLLLLDLRPGLLPTIGRALDCLLECLPEKCSKKSKMKRRLVAAKAQIYSLLAFQYEPGGLHTRLDFVPCTRMLREGAEGACFGTDIQDWLQNMELPPVQLRMSHLERLGQLGENHS
jgi:hypothetical protein